MNIDYPFHFDASGHTAQTPTADHVRDMLEQLLLTNPGERVNRPEFGSGVLQLVFSGNTPELASALQFTVQAAIETWLGDVVDIEALEVSSEDTTLRINLQYIIRSTGERRTDSFERSAA